MMMESGAVHSAASRSEWGEELASFAPTRVPVHLAILNKIWGMLVFFGASAYDAGDEQWLRVPFFLVGALFAFAVYRMATRHKRPDVVVYENGIWCRLAADFSKKRNFFRWSEIKSVEQIGYYAAPTSGFAPGVLIHLLGEKRKMVVYQRVERYTELYRIFYQRKIKNSDTPLQLFDVDIRGYVCANRGWYTSLYYPDKNKIVQFKGRPFSAI